MSGEKESEHWLSDLLYSEFAYPGSIHCTSAYQYRVSCILVIRCIVYLEFIYLVSGTNSEKGEPQPAHLIGQVCNINLHFINSYTLF